MIFIYASTDSGVPSHMGLGALSPSSCIITEDLNGKFELAMTHPIDENGKCEKIDQQRIIKAPTHRGVQLFRIYNVFKDPITQKALIVQARHIFYDLLDNFLEDVRPEVKDGQDAGDYILAGCETATSFTFSSDIEDISTAYYVRKNPVAALIGSEDKSFINRWGGEIERDNYSIAINTRIGADNGVKIAYRKNITGLEITVDDTSVITRLMPTALDVNGAVITTDAKYYDSPLISNYPHPKYGTLDTKIRVGQEVDGSIPYPTESDAKIGMAAMAEAFFTAGGDQPKTTLNASYVDLGKTEEYKEFAALFAVGLGDDVTVYYPPLDIDIKLRMISIEWDSILDEPYNAILGNFAPNIAKTVVSNDIDISALNAAAPTNIKEGESYNGVKADHTKGFWTTMELGGKTVETRQNGDDGFAIYVDDVYKGGVKLINGEVGLIGNILMNDIMGDCYATIGEVVDGITTYKGIIIYLKIGGTFTAVGKIIVTDGGTIAVLDSSNKIRAWVLAGSTEILSPNTLNALGVNNTGAYKRISGSTTPL